MCSPMSKISWVQVVQSSTMCVSHWGLMHLKICWSQWWGCVFDLDIFRKLSRMSKLDIIQLIWNKSKWFSSSKMAEVRKYGDRQVSASESSGIMITKCHDITVERHCSMKNVKSWHLWWMRILCLRVVLPPLTTGQVTLWSMGSVHGQYVNLQKMCRWDHLQ